MLHHFNELENYSNILRHYFVNAVEEVTRVFVIELVRRSVIYSRRSTIGIQLSNRNRNYRK